MSFVCILFKSYKSSSVFCFGVLCCFFSIIAHTSPHLAGDETCMVCVACRCHRNFQMSRVGWWVGRFVVAISHFLLMFVFLSDCQLYGFLRVLVCVCVREFFFISILFILSCFLFSFCNLNEAILPKAACKHYDNGIAVVYTNSKS